MKVIIAFILILIFCQPTQPMALANEDFSWDRREISDAKGQSVVVFICEGTKKSLEAVVFSMNVYGDRTLNGYKSLKEFGSGRISGSQIALDTIPSWAKSSFSTEPQEIEQNQKFSQFLIEQGILDKDHQLAPKYAKTPASILFYFSDMRQEPDSTQIHENSHVFYNNLISYKKAAGRVFASLKKEQDQCVLDFFKKKDMYAIDDTDVFMDEFMAYYIEEHSGLKSCFGDFGADINKDGSVSADEEYLWRTSHPK